MALFNFVLPYGVDVILYSYLHLADALGRAQPRADLYYATPMLHHDTFVGTCRQALALSQHRIFESWFFGWLVLYNTTRSVPLLHANLTDLKLRICKSSLHDDLPSMMP